MPPRTDILLWCGAVRSPWILAVAAAAAFAPSPAPAQTAADQVIVLQERVPFAFLLGTPTGAGARTSSSEIIRMVSDLLRAHTNLDLVILDPALMRDCRGRLGCLALAARDDYERSELLTPGGDPIPFREHVRRLRAARRAYPRYLLVLSNVTLEGQADRLSAVLVNTDLALTYHHESARRAPDWEDATEEKINSAAVVSEPARAQVANPEQTRAFLERLFTGPYRRAFEATSNWNPYGTIEIRSDLAGAAVVLDGQAVGTTQPGLTRLEKVTPGTRVLELTHPDRVPYRTEVRVRAGRPARADVDLARALRPGSDLPRQVTLWTGAALAVAGTALAVYGATRPEDGLRTVCFEASDCSSGRRFVTFGYDPEIATTDASAVNPSGVMVAPLGYSLAGSGAALGLGALLSDPEEVPWIAWIAGAAVGAAAYGISAAAAGP